MISFLSLSSAQCGTEIADLFAEDEGTGGRGKFIMTTSKLSKAPMTCSRPDLNMSDSRIGQPIKSTQLDTANYVQKSS